MEAIKCVSLNLWLGGKLMDAVLDFLERENPDILLLQEAYNETDSRLETRFRSLQKIQERCNLPEAHFAPMYLEKLPVGSIERGNAILTRFPIIATNTWWLCSTYGEYVDIRENFPTAPRNLQHASLRFGQSTLNVFNFQGVWDLDGENDSPARLKMSRVIIEAIKNKPNVILGGDTNVRPNTKTIQNLKPYLVNIFEDELVSTFNMRRKTNPGYATSVVDMLFVSPNFTVLEHDCPNVDISDHLPLTMTVRLSKATHL